MVSILLAIAPFIPIVLNIAGFFIKMYGTSEENLKIFKKLVENGKDTGKISVDSHIRLSAMHAGMEAEMEEKRKLQAAREVRVVHAEDRADAWVQAASIDGDLEVREIVVGDEVGVARIAEQECRAVTPAAVAGAFASHVVIRLVPDDGVPG